MTAEQPAEIARRLIRSNMYFTLGSADGDGTPWVSPVFYVAEGHAQFLWVSSPDAWHSRNVAERPEVSIVIFDSQVELGQAQAVYISARAEEVAGGGLEAAVQAFSRGSKRWGAREWTLEYVRAPAVHRLYRATASEYSVLDSVGHPRPGDRRIPVNLDDQGLTGR
jgi:nitroimidazol reductase NimA-like FMN-containing flavoprotein (pyridoxamine 5'-phosphate oxidase superfamily)